MRALIPYHQVEKDQYIRRNVASPRKLIDFECVYCACYSTGKFNILNFHVVEGVYLRIADAQDALVLVHWMNDLRELVELVLDVGDLTCNSQLWQHMTEEQIMLQDVNKENPLVWPYCLASYHFYMPYI